MRAFKGARRAFALLSQVHRLVRWRRDQGVILTAYDEHQVAWTMAKILAGVPPMALSRETVSTQRSDSPKHGLDFYTLTRAMKNAGLSLLGEHEIMTLIHDTLEWHERHPQFRPISGRAVGKALGLTALEREEVRCWIILPVDQTRAERMAKRKERKRQANRERAEARRQAEGRKPRDEYLGEAANRRALCERHGITRRTLARWLRTGRARMENGNVTSVYPEDISHLYRGDTDLGHLTPPCRAMEPEPAVPSAESALARADAHKGAIGHVRLAERPDAALQPTCLADLLQLLNETDTAIRGHSSELPAEAA